MWETYGQSVFPEGYNCPYLSWMQFMIHLVSIPLIEGENVFQKTFTMGMNVMYSIYFFRSNTCQYKYVYMYVN